MADLTDRSVRTLGELVVELTSPPIVQELIRKSHDDGSRENIAVCCLLNNIEALRVESSPMASRHSMEQALRRGRAFESPHVRQDGTIANDVHHREDYALSFDRLYSSVEATLRREPGPKHMARLLSGSSPVAKFLTVVLKLLVMDQIADILKPVVGVVDGNYAIASEFSAQQPRGSNAIPTAASTTATAAVPPPLGGSAVAAASAPAMALSPSAMPSPSAGPANLAALAISPKSPPSPAFMLSSPTVARMLIDCVLHSMQQLPACVWSLLRAVSNFYNDTSVAASILFSAFSHLETLVAPEKLDSPEIAVLLSDVHHLVRHASSFPPEDSAAASQSSVSREQSDAKTHVPFRRSSSLSGIGPNAALSRRSCIEDADFVSISRECSIAIMTAVEACIQSCPAFEVGANTPLPESLQGRRLAMDYAVSICVNLFRTAISSFSLFNSGTFDGVSSHAALHSFHLYSALAYFSDRDLCTSETSLTVLSHYMNTHTVENLRKRLFPAASILTRKDFCEMLDEVGAMALPVKYLFAVHNQDLHGSAVDQTETQLLRDFARDSFYLNGRTYEGSKDSELHRLCQQLGSSFALRDLISLGRTTLGGDAYEALMYVLGPEFCPHLTWHMTGNSTIKLYPLEGSKCGAFSAMGSARADFKSIGALTRMTYTATMVADSPDEIDREWATVDVTVIQHALHGESFVVIQGRDCRSEFVASNRNVTMAKLYCALLQHAKELQPFVPKTESAVKLEVLQRHRRRESTLPSELPNDL